MRVKFFKFIIALILMPLIAGEIWTLIDFARAAGTGPLEQSWFIAFGAGLVTWLAVYFLFSKTMWLYVFGHETTHAMAAMLAGGKVSSFKVTSKGGQVVTNRVNWWITLAPYFVPLYAILWMALWVVIDFFFPLKVYQPILYFGLGLFWCFHLTFTATMVHTRQTDFSSQGIVFSMVIILMINLIFFLLLFGILAHRFSWEGGTLLLNHLGESYVLTWQALYWAGAWVWKRARGGGSA